ncbi:MAG: sulfotransferase, partial [Pseudomonadales bacterium]|nr:sulfotransferase [Pseudomonadales bacterium]
YLERTRIQRQGAPYFIDKMPNNFQHVALINRILPNAKIIDARRHPMATCFSGYKQLFAAGQAFTYGQTNIAEYFNDYARLMAHWDEVLPGKVLRVKYERVIDNVEAEVRRLLDHCELPFETGCLSFFDTQRAVRTASSEQVRQPIYSQAVDQWRHYETHLDTMKIKLAPWISQHEAI